MVVKIELARNIYASYVDVNAIWWAWPYQFWFLLFYLSSKPNFSLALGIVHGGQK